MRACKEMKYMAIAMILAKVLQMKIQVRENILFVCGVALTPMYQQQLKLELEGNITVLKINMLVSRYLTSRVHKLNNDRKSINLWIEKYQEHICKMIHTICGNSSELSILVFLLLIIKVLQYVP
jgi:hypothetical protein